MSEMNKSAPEQHEKRRRLIELTQRDVKDAERLLTLMVESAPPAERERKVAVPPQSERLVKLAGDMIRDRRLRSRFFNQNLFGESGWDLLLILYTMDDSGPRLSIGRLQQYAGAASSSTARWLATLEDQRLIRRESHPTDARSNFVQLTDRGRTLLELYLSETLTLKS